MRKTPLLFPDGIGTQFILILALLAGWVYLAQLDAIPDGYGEVAAAGIASWIAARMTARGRKEEESK